MSKNNSITPVRLRPATEASIGTTAFFRNRPLYDVLLNKLRARGKSHYKILFHACSIGAEVYSFLIHHNLGGYIDDFTIELHATDLETNFVDYSRNGVYPSEILTGMTQEESSFFVNTNNGASVVEELKHKVSFLDAVSFIDFESNQTFDVVFLLNTLIYVPENKQHEVIDKVATYNSDILVVSAFHMNSIKNDLSRNHYQPQLESQREIHDSWIDRRVSVNSNELAPGIYANWRLPEFSKIEDYEYKYCAIFSKHRKNK